MNLGPAPGLESGLGDNLFALHVGSQGGPILGGDGVAGEAIIEQRFLFGKSMFGVRGSFFVRGLAGDNDEGIAGILLSAIGGATITEGLGVYAGLGYTITGSMTDASKREGDAGAFDALVGGTWWLVTDDSFGWGLTTELDLLTGSGDFPASDGIPKR